MAAAVIAAEASNATPWSPLWRSRRADRPATERDLRRKASNRPT